MKSVNLQHVCAKFVSTDASVLSLSLPPYILPLPLCVYAASRKHCLSVRPVLGQSCGVPTAEISRPLPSCDFRTVVPSLRCLPDVVSVVTDNPAPRQAEDRLSGGCYVMLQPCLANVFATFIRLLRYVAMFHFLSKVNLHGGGHETGTTRCYCVC